MRVMGKTGPIIILLLTLIPLWFWYPSAVFSNLPSVFRSIGQITALTGTVLFCLNFFLATRWRFLENLFNGLNRVYIIHHLIGALGFILLLLHPVFIIGGYLSISLEAALNLIVPSLDNIPVQIGFAALISMIGLLLITFYVRLEYDLWKKTHTVLGLPLLLASFHVLTIGSTLASDIRLKIYITAFFVIAVISYVYRLIYKYGGVGRYRYKVSHIQTINDIKLIGMTPVGRKMLFNPGQFAFIEVYRKGILKESHPFSLINSPTEQNLVFAAKSLGDYTETLKLVEPGTDILVEGPYGKFSYIFYKNPNQIWVGGGIGITPFISMLRSLPTDGLTKVTLYYCVRNRKEALFAEELERISLEKPNTNVVIWASSDQGRMTANKITEKVTEYKSAEYFVCGPSGLMMSLKNQLKNIGVKSARIHTEEFSLY